MKKISAILSILASIVLFLASAVFFQCPKMDSGEYMNCHKANVGIAVLAVVLLVLGILLLLSKKGRTASLLSVLMIAAAVISALVPVAFVQLCMMPEMTCRAILRPVDLILSVIILVCGVIRLAAEGKKAGEGK